MKNKSINNNIFNYLIYSLAILNVIFYLIYNLNIELIQFLLFVILGYLLSKRNIIFIIIVGVILINTILIDKIYNRKNIIEGNGGQDSNAGPVDTEEEAAKRAGGEVLATDAQNQTNDFNSDTGPAQEKINDAQQESTKITDTLEGVY